MERNSKEFIEQLVEYKFRKNVGEENYREYKWAADFLKKVNKYGFCNICDHLDLEKAKEIAERLQYKYCKKADVETAESHTTTHYIWHTQEDYKVRSSHATNDGKVFAWDNPPATGNPGEDYGCRCWAEAYKPKENELYEHKNQIVTEQEADKRSSWEWEDFVYHYLTAEGDSVTLSEIGHLSDIIDCAKNYEQIQLEGKGTIFSKVEDDICKQALGHDVKSFHYNFHKAYDFKEYVYSIGGATIWGNGEVIVEEAGEYLIITSELSYTFYDVFTDVFSLGELSDKFRKRLDDYMKAHTEKGIKSIIGEYDIPLISYPYQILGSWSTHFEAVIKKSN